MRIVLHFVIACKWENICFSSRWWRTETKKIHCQSRSFLDALGNVPRLKRKVGKKLWCTYDLVHVPSRRHFIWLRMRSIYAYRRKAPSCNAALRAAALCTIMVWTLFHYTMLHLSFASKHSFATVNYALLWYGNFPKTFQCNQKCDNDGIDCGQDSFFFLWWKGWCCGKTYTRGSGCVHKVWNTNILKGKK